MSEMVERVAKAIQEVMTTSLLEQIEKGQSPFENAARAALTATGRQDMIEEALK